VSTVKDLLARRSAHLSPALSVHYRRPVHVARGSGQYLYDTAGVRYLDCINNVPLVGHSHPAVTEAVCRQLSLVNTNTRFLYEVLAEYADRLAALFPAPLSVCFFVNSGSEANELALRLGRAHTGRRGVVVLDHAYHGNTTSLVDISPYKFAGRGGSGRPAHVQVAAAPDVYRGRYRGPDAAERYAGEVAAALDRARGESQAGQSQAGQSQAGQSQAGQRAAGLFFAEAILGCAGQVDPPSGFLPAAYRLARDAGAVVVADEVQIGFGRVGSHWWGFAAHGAQPDIVSLGKPIGNGFPLGAVVTTPEIAASFANGMEYFSTFGGNPLACAAGLAVLDVLEAEGLRAHAAAVGAHLAAGFTALAARHEAIGDVRGRGLFLGVDLVTDRASRAPATQLARDLVETLREQDAILLSTEGPGDNVLKIKPPLPFGVADADLLLDAVDRYLTRHGRI
jgi:4-aminobutyrate aminotransferase-like enzyme